MSDHHNAISLYGKTLSREIPLVLAFGREPNGTAVKVSGVGPYDFLDAPRCAFWNVAHNAAGSTVSAQSGAWFKKFCIEHSSSPITFADALPITIKNKVAGKHAIRSATTEEAISSHIEHIFSLNEVIDRVGLIIFSGLDAPVFGKSIDLITKRAKSISIPFLQVPFFYPTNTQKIRNAMDMFPVGTEAFRKIISEFLALNGASRDGTRLGNWSAA